MSAERLLRVTLRSFPKRRGPPRCPSGFLYDPMATALPTRTTAGGRGRSWPGDRGLPRRLLTWRWRHPPSRAGRQGHLQVPASLQVTPPAEKCPPRPLPAFPQIRVILQGFKPGALHSRPNLLPPGTSQITPGWVRSGPSFDPILSKP